MILELLAPEIDGLRIITSMLRVAYYAACLLTGGLVLFLATMGRLLDGSLAAVFRRRAAVAAVIGIVIAVVSLGVQVLLASGGDLLDDEAWSAIITSRSGQSLLVAAAGLVLIGAPFLLRLSGSAIALLGALLVAASFTLVGHTTQGDQRPLLAFLLIIHLLGAAFWFASLWPLIAVSRGGGTNGLKVIERWSRVAMATVPALVGAGFALAWLIVGSLDALFGTTYGIVLIVKVALVGVLLGFAAWHVLRLTPDLAAGHQGAGKRLAHSIGFELVVMLLVIFTVAELTSVTPHVAVP
nr:CopD family protein [uncultured Roseococcus sp.]